MKLTKEAEREVERTDILERFSERLGDLIENKKGEHKGAIGQNDIAEKIGITKSALSKYKKAGSDGGAEAGASSLVRIAKYFDCTVDYLLGLTDVKSRNEDIQITCYTTRLYELAVYELIEISKSKQFGAIEIGVLSELISRGHIHALVKIIRNAMISNYQQSLLLDADNEEENYMFNVNSSHYELELSKMAISVFNESFNDMMNMFIPNIQTHVRKNAKALVEHADLIRKQMVKIEKYLIAKNEQLDTAAFQAAYLLRKLADDYSMESET